ncbi:MAG: hypothetical protein ABI978_03715 [Chloroflexota bacterium]
MATQPRLPRTINVTIRVDDDALIWARVRAFFGCTSINALVAAFLKEYAAVPDRWRQGLPPPWTPEDRIRPVMDPLGAGLAAAMLHAPAEVVEAAIAQAIWDLERPSESEDVPRQG